jgi:glycosyltransferase involved in cell wall biosynthesis
MKVDWLLNAKRIHVCTTDSHSGITAYAHDFHKIALEPEGYVLADPETIRSLAPRFAPDTHFHIQLGGQQRAERLAMSALQAHGHLLIDATIHDPPFVTFPYFQFQSRHLMRLSRGFDWYLGSLGVQRRALTRLRHIYVLSQIGKRKILELAPASKVTTIPHLISSDAIWPLRESLGNGLLFFGFIGPGKGLEYALQLHRALLRLRPNTPMHVVGQPDGRSGERYLSRLKAEYRDSVTFHGYLPSDDLDSIFTRAAHVILPYKEYSHIMPASGSAIQAIRRGCIVWASGVNAVPELVIDGENGFILTMDTGIDACRLAAVLENDEWAQRISEGARQTSLKIAAYPYRKHFKLDVDQ